MDGISKEIDSLILATNALAEAMSMFYQALVVKGLPENIIASLMTSYMETLMRGVQPFNKYE